MLKHDTKKWTHVVITGWKWAGPFKNKQYQTDSKHTDCKHTDSKHTDNKYTDSIPTVKNIEKQHAGNKKNRQKKHPLGTPFAQARRRIFSIVWGHTLGSLRILIIPQTCTMGFWCVYKARQGLPDPALLGNHQSNEFSRDIIYIGVFETPVYLDGKVARSRALQPQQ